MLRKWSVFLLLVLSLVLAACSPQAEQSPVETAPVVTLAPTEDMSAAPTSAPTQVAAPTDAPTQAVAATAAPTQEVAATPAATDDNSLPSTGSSDDGDVFVIVPGESKASYSVGETFLEDNRFNTAVGVTDAIQGEVRLDRSDPQSAQIGPIEIDISKLASDSNRRDGTIRDRFLESARFPIATFVSTDIQGLPDTYTEGTPISFQVTGDLTIREVTLPVTFEVTATLQGDELTGIATSSILMSDYGFGPINIAGMLGTEDEVQLKLDFVARHD